MGHEPSQFAPLDPDLEDENELVQLIPLLVAEIIAEERALPQAQCTSILTGRGYVEELFQGNMHTFRTVARMDKETFMRLVTLLRSAGLDGADLDDDNEYLDDGVDEEGGEEEKEEKEGGEEEEGNGTF